ncbi:MAG: hypothetical protein, partial [Olavius algarvensis Gamma 1 endosymbiont]
WERGNPREFRRNPFGSYSESSPNRDCLSAKDSCRLYPLHMKILVSEVRLSCAARQGSAKREAG